MSSDGQSPNETSISRRLNPFAFPAETDARFNLVIISALAVIFNLSIASFIKINFGPFSSLSFLGVMTFGEGEALPEQVLWTLAGLPVWSGGALIVLIGVSLLRFHRHPDLIRRSFRLREPDPGKEASLLQALADLAAGVGFRPLPTIELGPENALDGQAFGLPKTPVLRLGGHVNRLRIANPPRFRALVLHELAHHANRDVIRSYFAEAVWRAFLILILPLYAILLLGYLGEYFSDSSPGSPLSWVITIFFGALFLVFSAIFHLVQISLLAGLVALMRREALRVREVYADWRAARWGAREGLVEILKENLDRPKEGFFRRLRRFHPSPQERLKSLEDPSELFKLRTYLPAMVGVLLAYIIAGGMPILQTGLTLWRQTWGPSGLSGGPLLSLLAPTLVLLILLVFVIFTLGTSWLVSSVLGVKIMRQAAAELAQGERGLRPYLRLILPALMVPLFFDVGLWIVPYDNITILPFFSDLPLYLLQPGLILLTGAILWFWMSVLRYAAVHLFGTHTGDVPPRAKIRFLIGVGTLLLPVLLGPAVTGRAVLLGYPQMLLPFLLSLLFSAVIAVFAAAGVWILALWLRESRMAACPTCRQGPLPFPVLGRTCRSCGSELASWLY
jgi:Zn-dependent protease with chaperone function